MKFEKRGQKLTKERAKELCEKVILEGSVMKVGIIIDPKKMHKQVSGSVPEDCEEKMSLLNFMHREIERIYAKENLLEIIHNDRINLTFMQVSLQS